MTLTRRLVLVVSASVGVAILGAAAALGLLARNALFDQAENQAQLVAGMIATEANRAGLVSDRIDRVVAREIEAQAIAVSHLAEALDGDAGAVAVHLAEITADSAIDDIRLIDRDGRSVARAIGGVSEAAGGAAGPADLGGPVLEALLSGRRFSVALRSAPESGLERPLRYVGARSRAGGAVLVGSVADKTSGLTEAIGLVAALNSLAGQPGIRAIWVVDDLLEVTASVLGAASGDAPEPAFTADDKALAGRAVSAGARSFLGADALHVAAPILDRGGVATGAAVIHMPRDRLDRLFADHIRFGLMAALGAFAVGSAIAMLFARRITRPVMALTRAAEEMDRRSFAPESLNPVAHRRDELGRLVRVFQAMAREVQAREDHLEALVAERTLDLERKNAQLERARKRMEEELGIAQTLQGAILPKAMPPHQAYSGSALMTPAREMGGDFYDFFTLPDGRLGVVIADVSGKGVPAAFFMAIARTVTRGTAQDHDSPGICLREVNNAICAQNPHDLFVTLFYGILDPATGSFSYANAGHNAPYLVRPDGAVDALPMTGGVAVGVMPDLPYEEKTMTLASGDTLFLYTDGISEAMNEQGEMFEEARVESTLALGHELPVDGVIDNVTVAVGAFVGDTEQSDDITCVVLRYDAAQA